MSTTINCVICGAEAEVEVAGRYLPATLYEPAEYPEVGYNPSCECQEHKAVNEAVYIEMMQERAEEAAREPVEPDGDW